MSVKIEPRLSCTDCTFSALDNDTIEAHKMKVHGRDSHSLNMDKSALDYNSCKIENGHMMDNHSFSEPLANGSSSEITFEDLEETMEEDNEYLRENDESMDETFSSEPVMENEDKSQSDAELGDVIEIDESCVSSDLFENHENGVSPADFLENEESDSDMIEINENDLSSELIENGDVVECNDNDTAIENDTTVEATDDDESANKSIVSKPLRDRELDKGKLNFPLRKVKFKKN